MKNCKQVRIILLLLSIITGTVAPMEQPDPQQAKAGWTDWLKSSFSKVSSPVVNLYCWQAQKIDALDKWAYPETEQGMSQAARDENDQLGQGIIQDNRQEIENVAANNRAETRGHAAINRREGQDAHLPVEQPQILDQLNAPLSRPVSPKASQQQNTPPVSAPQQLLATKRPVWLYCTLGGSSLTIGAALVYKAIDYVQLSGVKNNLISLDALIDAAQQYDDANVLKELYELKKADLTLLVDAEKGLLLHLVPEKEKFVEAATKLKQGLVECAKKSLFSRISYGIRHDVKRAQGWSVRAGNAIKEKLGKLFRVGKQ